MILNQHTALIIADPSEMKNSYPVWGTGGWQPADDRRALDWFTLCRFLGLRVLAITPQEYEPSLIDDQVKWVIVACRKENIDHNLIFLLELTLEQARVSVICPASEKGTPFSDWSGVFFTNRMIKGRSIFTPGWPDKNEWRCRDVVETKSLSIGNDSVVIAFLEQSPLIVSTGIGKGKVIITGFDPGELRDKEGIFTPLLQRLIIFSSTEPLPWIDWQDTLVLRMDDPGSSEAIYNKSYSKSKLSAEEWKCIGEELAKRDARMSLGYVSGWVDAGETCPGRLKIDGEEVSREEGRIHPSPTVQFETRRKEGSVVFDYIEEFEAIQALRKAGLVEVELHGYTHIFPDRQAWINAGDRYENNSWFREFGAKAVQFLDQNPHVKHPVNEALDLFQLYFKTKPTTLICPGEEFTNDVLIKALNEGIMLVSSYYLAIRDHSRFCWTQYVCAPYLDLANEKWFDADLPVVGYFHDFDIAEKGMQWFSDCLGRWQAAGAKKIMDLNELNAVLNLQWEMKKSGDKWELEVISNTNYPLPRPVELMIFFPDGKVPSGISAKINNRSSFLKINEIDRNLGSATILK